MPLLLFHRFLDTATITVGDYIAKIFVMSSCHTFCNYLVEVNLTDFFSGKPLCFKSEVEISNES